jgi:hypothetical protein
MILSLIFLVILNLTSIFHESILIHFISLVNYLDLVMTKFGTYLIKINLIVHCPLWGTNLKSHLLPPSYWIFCVWFNVKLNYNKLTFVLDLWFYFPWHEKCSQFAIFIWKMKMDKNIEAKKVWRNKYEDIAKIKEKTYDSFKLTKLCMLEANEEII